MRRSWRRLVKVLQLNPTQRRKGAQRTQRKQERENLKTAMNSGQSSTNPDRFFSVLFFSALLRDLCVGTWGLEVYSKDPQAVVLNPASTYNTSPVIPLARSLHRNAAALPTSSVVKLRRSGAVFWL